MRRVIGVLPLVAAGVLLAFVGSAAAESGPPADWAAGAQYVEMIPTSTGLAEAGAPGPTRRLPPSLGAQLARSGGDDAQALETLVTSSGWGAVARPRSQQPPPRTSRGRRPGERRPPASSVPTAPALAVPLPQETTSVSGSLGSALTGGGRATFALVAVLSLLAAAALRRLARSRR